MDKDIELGDASPTEVNRYFDEQREHVEEQERLAHRKAICEHIESEGGWDSFTITDPTQIRDQQKALREAPKTGVDDMAAALIEESSKRIAAEQSAGIPE